MYGYTDSYVAGRLADHIRSGTKLYLSRIRFLVLDEADRLLEDDFGEDLGTIFAPGLLPAARQTLLFSATFSDPLRELLNVTLKEPFAYFETAPYDCSAYTFKLLCVWRAQQYQSYSYCSIWAS